MTSEQLQRQCDHSPKDQVFGYRENGLKGDQLKKGTTHELTKFNMSKKISDMSVCYLQISLAILDEEQTPRNLYTRTMLLIDSRKLHTRSQCPSAD